MLETGSRLGPYEILGALGEGGMATVYLAEDAKHHRKVALKFLRATPTESAERERFTREIEIAAGLRHAHIVPLFDSGEHDGRPYYVMPRIEGETLRERLRRDRRLPVEDAVRLAGEIADALAYAHGRGLVHRDIKPENILLDGGHALVADFGIARAIHAARSDGLTLTGSTLGTPAYMSPEQCMGEGDVDGRADQYSLACVVFEMLSGAPPFAGDSADAAIVKRFTQPPPRVAERAPGVPARVDAALFRAMSRRPEDRFTDVARFADALRDSAGVAAGPSEGSIAVLAFTNLGGSAEDEYFCDGISEEIINALAQVPGLRVVARTSSFAFKGKNEDLRRIGEQLSVATVLEGSIRRAGNRLRITAQLVDVKDGYHLWSERYEREMTDVFAIQDEIAAAVASRFTAASVAPKASEPDRRLTNNLEAYELYLKGRALQYKRGRWVLPARDCFVRAVELDPNFADALAMMADSYRLMALNAVAPPSEVIPLARAAAERSLALDPTVAEAHAVLAAVTSGYDRDFALAARHWAEALRLNPDHVRSLAEHALWGLIGIRQQFDAGLAEVERAVALDPLNAYVAGMHANALVMSGRRDAAVVEGTRAVALDPESFVARHLQVEVLIGAGEFAAAAAAADAALLITGRHPWVLATKGVALGLAGDVRGAVAIDTELRSRAQTDFVSSYVLATSASGTGNLDEAFRLAERSVEDRDLMAVMGRNYPDWVLVRRHPGFPDLLARMGMGNDA